MRPSGQIVLQETIRNLPVVTTASVLTASDPLLRSENATTAILKNAGAGLILLVNCILCDGKGGILPGAILRVRIGSKIASGVEGGDVVVTTGTPLMRTGYSNFDASDNLGGIIDIVSSATGAVKAAITVAASPAVVTLEHLHCTVGAPVVVT